MTMHEHRVVLVTGSTQGIGKAAILELAKIDFSVIVNGASTQNLPQDYFNTLKEIYGNNLDERFLYIQADISKKADRQKLLEKTKNKFGRIDVLVNNAGVAPKVRQDILKASEESYDRVLAVNLKGPFFLSQIFSNWMIELKTSLNDEYSPYIINISSINRYTSSTNRGEYCISKAGIHMMTKLYADRLAEYGIPVFEISPGIIETAMTEKVHLKYDKLIEGGFTPINRWGKPLDIAKPIIAIVNGLLPFSTGTVIDIDGGFHLHRL